MGDELKSLSYSGPGTGYAMKLPKMSGESRGESKQAGNHGGKGKGVAANQVVVCWWVLLRAVPIAAR